MWWLSSLASASLCSGCRPTLASALISTLTVSVSMWPSLSTSSRYCGASLGILQISSSIWVGNTFTPRMISMSSERPVIFAMRRMLRAVGGSRRVRSRVR